MQELPGLFSSDNLTLYGCSIEVHPELTNPCDLWFSVRRLTQINWCSVGYSQVRSLLGSFGSHKEMLFPKGNKLIVLNMVDKEHSRCVELQQCPGCKHHKVTDNRFPPDGSMIWKSPLPTEYVNTKSDNLWIVNWNLESLFTTLTCMNSLGSCINTFSRYRKARPKNELGTLLIFDLTPLHFEKYFTLSHSAKCSVSTQLAYI